MWNLAKADNYYPNFLGPPGQVATVAGPKAGMKQGQLSGILKELGYNEDQVIKILFLKGLGIADPI